MQSIKKIKRQYKKLLNKIFNYDKKNILNSIKNSRPSSAPFVSGDSYRSLADIIIDNSEQLLLIPDFIEMQSIEKKIIVIYIALSIMEDDNNKNILLNIFSRKINRKINLVFHNGDIVPDNNYFLNLIKFVNKIMCVNILDFHERIIPLPIGLENMHHISNGIIENYANIRNSNINLERIISRKNTLIYSQFSPNTNLERSKLIHMLNNSEHIFQDRRIENNDYQKNILKSMFVLSPPGNGIDCHRTWEALALYSIPIIKSGYLAKSLISKAPIIEVNDWNEILFMNKDDLIKLYHRKIYNNDYKINELSYWLENIFN